MYLNHSHEIIIVNSFSSVFLDSINNDTIEYDSSEMESIRFNSSESNHEKSVNIVELNTQKKTFSFLKIFFCYCFVNDK